jgi:hypothetical protein
MNASPLITWESTEKEGLLCRISRYRHNFKNISLPLTSRHPVYNSDFVRGNGRRRNAAKSALEHNDLLKEH